MNNINQMLSKKDKIQQLSDEAIKDIYSRQIILKIAKNRRGVRYIKIEIKPYNDYYYKKKVCH